MGMPEGEKKHAWITHEIFYAKLAELVEKQPAGNLLRYDKVYQILSEELHDDVVNALQQERMALSLAQSQIDDYVALREQGKSAPCPFCGTPNPDSKSFHDGCRDGWAIQSLECGKCGAGWDEQYKLTNIIVVGLPDHGHDCSDCGVEVEASCNCMDPNEEHLCGGQVCYRKGATD